jgi:hypothetical protein
MCRQVQGKDALDNAEREHREDDSARGEPEAALAERRAVSLEAAVASQRRHGRYRGDAQQGEHEICRERPVDAPDRAERRADEAANGVRGEHTAQAHVLLARPPFERRERDSDPQTA